MPIMQTVIQGGGTTPTGTINITANGTYDVTDKASANVAVPTTAPAHYIELSVDANGKLVSSSSVVNLNGATDIGDYLFAHLYAMNMNIAGAIDFSSLTSITGQEACSYMFNNCPGVTSIDMSSVTQISSGNTNFCCQFMFSGCMGLTSADMRSVTAIRGTDTCYYMFSNCATLVNVNLSSLTTIDGQTRPCAYMFSGCRSLPSIDMSSLASVTGYRACYYMFQGCTGLTSVDMSSLATVGGNTVFNYMFSGCTSLATVRLGNTAQINFDTYTTSFAGMFQGCTQNIDVYAPAANQAQIEAMPNYPNFGGTGTVTWHWNS